MAVNGTITTAGAAYLSQRISAMAAVNIDHFVLANVPGIDESTEADPEYELQNQYIVATAPVFRLAYNGENAAVWSMVLDGSEGDYDFNWYGLVSDTNELIAYAHIPPVAKRANVGQVINRNFILPFTAAKALTGADIPAESWQFDFTETVAELVVSLKGPKVVYAGGDYAFELSDWDDFSTYFAFSDGADVVISDGQLLLSMPDDAVEGPLKVTVVRNGTAREIELYVGSAIVNRPAITSPHNGDVDVAEDAEFTTNAFSTNPAEEDYHYSSDWILSTDVWMNNIVWEVRGDTVNLTKIKIPKGVMQESKTYYLHNRHNGSHLGSSEYAIPIQFTTKSQFIPSEPGMPFRGGFFVAVIDDGVEPYALVIAPRFGGEASNRLFKTTATADIGASSLVDGVSNTAALDDEYHPAVAFVKSLSIGGFNDWVAPSLYELDVIYRVFKPTANDNSVGGRDDGRQQGESVYYPPYTATDPAQTEVDKFKSGGTEALSNLSTYYWSSSESVDDPTKAWAMNMRDGYQNFRDKRNGYSVRAVRKVPIV